MLKSFIPIKLWRDVSKCTLVVFSRVVCGAVRCGLESKPQTTPHIRFEFMTNCQPHYMVWFGVDGLYGLGAASNEIFNFVTIIC